MAIKVGINGYGRIGRNVLRALYESGRTGEIQIVAINDLGDANTNAHLTRYDTAHGRFNGQVSVEGDSMIVNGDRIRVLAQRDPAKLPWGELGVDIVFECTGLFTSKAKARWLFFCTVQAAVPVATAISKATTLSLPKRVTAPSCPICWATDFPVNLTLPNTIWIFLWLVLKAWSIHWA